MVGATEPVTPLAGVWIEIASDGCYYHHSLVTPLAGVWIEISRRRQHGKRFQSLPLRECGLKF